MFRSLDRIFVLFLIVFLLVTSFSLPYSLPFPIYLRTANAQPITLKDMVKYQKQSNFIKEFKVPFSERGLKGIITDSLGNVWFYHSTYNTSTIVRFNPESMNFTKYEIVGKMAVDNAIANLAGGQLVFDGAKNIVWFTDARTNSVGQLDVKTGKIQLSSIPTAKSGPMGIALSSDRNHWQ